MRLATTAAALLLLACSASAARNLTDAHGRGLKVGFGLRRAPRGHPRSADAWQMPRDLAAAHPTASRP